MGLALATTNLSAKFEVSIATYYKDMKGDTKCGKWRDCALLRSLEIAPFVRTYASSY